MIEIPESIFSYSFHVHCFTSASQKYHLNYFFFQFGPSSFEVSSLSSRYSFVFHFEVSKPFLNLAREKKIQIQKKCSESERKGYFKFTHKMDGSEETQELLEVTPSTDKIRRRLRYVNVRLVIFREPRHTKFAYQISTSESK